MRKITLFFLLMLIVCGAFMSCHKDEDSVIVIENVTAGIERNHVFEEYTVTRKGHDKEHPFEYYCADGGILNTWATVVVEFWSPSAPEVFVEDFPQGDDCNSILIKCEGMGDGKWKAVIWTIVGHSAKITITNSESVLCFGIVTVGDVDSMDSQQDQKFDILTEDDFQQAASSLGVSVAVVKALDEVLSNNEGGFFSEYRPTIKFEGHIFWKELQKKGLDPMKYVKGQEDILYEKWTKVYYKRGIAEYNRLARARKIDDAAALCATCWGAYKMMGNNYEKCGYSDVLSFVKDMIENRRKQLDIFCAYVKNTEGDKYLRKLDFAGFAKYYDSAQYAVDRLDERLEQAYAKYADGNDH